MKEGSRKEGKKEGRKEREKEGKEREGGQKGEREGKSHTIFTIYQYSLFYFFAL